MRAKLRYFIQTEATERHALGQMIPLEFAHHECNRRTALQLIVVDHTHDQHSAIRNLARQVMQQLQTRLTGGVQIVQNEQQGRMLRE